MATVKKPTTFSQQVKLIEAKNITVSNERLCEQFLMHTNYYRFSAYFLPFEDSGTKRCSSPVPFERIVDIYNFDKELRHLISTLIESIEINLRTKIAYHHSHKYGSLGYKDAGNYNKGHNHNRFLSNYRQCISENANSPVVLHHKQKYGGKFPLWVIVEFFHLGMLSHFYTDLLVPDQKAIAKDFNTSYLNILSWFKCLNDLRNRCAHYSRLYFWNFTSIPRQDRSWTTVPDNTLFSQILMLKSLCPDKKEWKRTFLSGLKSIIKKNEPSIDLHHIGFPNDWEDILK